MNHVSERRLTGPVGRGRPVTLVVDGAAVPAFEGESVAAALLAARRRSLRVTPKCGEPRGMYCGIGLCFECVMVIDGQPGTRTCLTPVRDGMRVEAAHGGGTGAAGGCGGAR
jgi:D-hydroxyproline dehydrogenase subunit gamma